MFDAKDFGSVKINFRTDFRIYYKYKMLKYMQKETFTFRKNLKWECVKKVMLF